MKITFFSNFMNHHQKPFCDSMFERIGADFVFVATRELPSEQGRLGYKNMNESASYILNAHHGECEFKQAMRLALESDVVIRGAADYKFVEERLKKGKLTFRYSERFFKEGYLRLLDPRVAWFFYCEETRHRLDPYYMLCASAYTALDCRYIHAYPNKTYKWGYFPEVKKYKDIDDVLHRKRRNSILWVGRLIDWKHPEKAVLLAEKLKKAGYQFQLRIIGIGPMENKLKKMIENKKLSDCVQMLGSMSPEKVREHMERSQIFIFTSDKNEGWGAVLNESMNSACAVVANKEIGSVPFLIEDGVNGLQFDRKKKDDLYIKVKSLLDDKAKTHALQRCAYDTMISTWNADTAAGRLLHLIECIQNDKEVEYENGPCSKDYSRGRK